jgi:hypothetical protein
MNQVLVLEYWTAEHELWVSEFCWVSEYWRSGKARPSRTRVAA